MSLSLMPSTTAPFWPTSTMLACLTAIPTPCCPFFPLAPLLYHTCTVRNNTSTYTKITTTTTTYTAYPFSRRRVCHSPALGITILWPVPFTPLKVNLRTRSSCQQRALPVWVWTSQPPPPNEQAPLPPAPSSSCSELWLSVVQSILNYPAGSCFFSNAWAAALQLCIAVPVHAVDFCASSCESA